MSSPEQPYHSIAPQEYWPVRMDPGTGQIHQPREGEGPKHSIAEVEEILVRDTSFLIAALDGSMDTEVYSRTYLNEAPRYEGPCDAAIYLDKSARPVRALVKEFWDEFSDEKMPDASFLNIDKIDYLYEMGYTNKDLRERIIPPEEIDVQTIDPYDLRMRTAQIRALYLEDRSKLEAAEALLNTVKLGEAPLEALDELWQWPTLLDDKHVAIIDEVKSSAATLAVADQLLALSFPDAKLEPLFWSTPRTFKQPITLDDGREAYTLADTEKPLWYSSKTSDGRGGIGAVNELKALSSPSVTARIGALVLSRPYTEENGHSDTSGIGYRKDFKTLRERFNDGKVKRPADVRRQDS